MKLLPNEEKILMSKEEKIILTDHRITMYDSILGQSFQISIFLENISSLEVKFRSRIIFLVSGLICILGGIIIGIMQEGVELTSTVIGFGLLLLVLWWYSRTHLIVISSNGGSPMMFRVSGMRDSEIDDLLYEISMAKQNRVKNIFMP